MAMVAALPELLPRLEQEVLDHPAVRRVQGQPGLGEQRLGLGDQLDRTGPFLRRDAVRPGPDPGGGQQPVGEHAGLAERDRDLQAGALVPGGDPEVAGAQRHLGGVAVGVGQQHVVPLLGGGRQLPPERGRGPDEITRGGPGDAEHVPHPRPAPGAEGALQRLTGDLRGLLGTVRGQRDLAAQLLHSHLVPGRRPGLPTHRLGLGGQGECGARLAATHQQVAERGEQPDPGRGRLRPPVGQCADLRDPDPQRLHRGMEPGQRAGQGLREPRLLVVQRGQHGAHVVDLEPRGVQPGQMRRVARTDQVLVVLGQPDGAARHRVALAEPTPRIGAHRLEIAVPGATGRRIGDQQRLVDQRPDQVTGLGQLALPLTHRSDHRPSGVQVERGDQQRELFQGVPLVVGEQAEVPLQQRLQPPLSSRPGGVLDLQHPDAAVQTGQDLARVQGADPGCCDLDGQRQAVQAAADGGDRLTGRRVLGELGSQGGGPVEEQGHRVRQLRPAGGQRRQAVQRLAGQVQRFGAGDHHGHPRAGAEHRNDQVCRRLDVPLAAVQDQHRPPAGQLPAQVLDRARPLVGAQSQCRGDRRGQQGAVLDRCAVDQPDAVRPGVRHRAGELAGKSRLAHPGSPDQGDQPVLGQQRGQPVELAGAPDQPGGPGRQVVPLGGQAARRRERGLRVRLVGRARRGGQLVEGRRQIEVANPEPAQRQQADRADAARGLIRDEHLAAVSGLAHPGGLMDGDRDVALTHWRGDPGVHPHPDPRAHPARPQPVSQVALRGSTGDHRVVRAGEGDQRAVTLTVDLVAAVLGPVAPQQVSMFVEQCGVEIGMLAEQPGGPFDVGDDEGDRPGGQPGRLRCHGVIVSKTASVFNRPAPRRPSSGRAGAPLGLEQGAQAAQGALAHRTDGTDRHVEPFGDLEVGQCLLAQQDLDQRPLTVRQLGERLAQQPAAAGLVQRFDQLILRVRPQPALQPGAVDRQLPPVPAAVGVALPGRRRGEPGAQTARGVDVVEVSQQPQPGGLRDVRGLGAGDPLPAGDRVHEAAVAPGQLGPGELVPGASSGQQPLRVRNSVDMGVGSDGVDRHGGHGVHRAPDAAAGQSSR